MQAALTKQILLLPACNVWGWRERFLPSREVEKVSERQDIGEAKAKVTVTIPSALFLTLPPMFPALANSPLVPVSFLNSLTPPFSQPQWRSLKVKALGDCPLPMSWPHFLSSPASVHVYVPLCVFPLLLDLAHLIPSAWGSLCLPASHVVRSQ